MAKAQVTDFRGMGQHSRDVGRASQKKSRRIEMKAMNKNKISAVVLALMVATVMAVAAPSASAVTLASLKGSWQATVIGQGGCGMGSKLLTFTLDSGGVSTSGTWASSTVSCGAGSVPLTFTITSLNADGSGTATVDAGTGVFHFDIQVNAASNMFNLVDISDANNYEEGSAIKQ
jgi:hypothetical protein